MTTTERPEKERFLLSIRFTGFKPYIPHALTAGQKLTDFLTKLTLRANYIAGGDFSRLTVPFKAVTTDILSGEKILLDRGNLADAMRATMAFPLAFTGVQNDGMILMDGGMVDPVPSDVVRAMNPNLDLVIAINTTSPLLPKEMINDPVDIANQVTTIMTMDKLAEGLRRADLVITPELNDYNSTDFKAVETLIQKGYEAPKS